jgi:hypothetical protein
MEASTDHERELAGLVDALAAQHETLPVSAVASIPQSVHFRMSTEESQFLVRYIIWRRDHPLSRQ